MVKRVMWFGIGFVMVASVVVSTDWATYAATGDSLLLGSLNKANQPTGVKNTGQGPALELTTKPGAPPLAVNSETKVLNLNADLLDGLDSSALANDTYVFTDDRGGSLGSAESYAFPTVRPGTYLVTLSGEIVASEGSVGAPTYVSCEVFSGASGFYAESSTYKLDGQFQAISGADVITIDNFANFSIECGVSAGTFKFGLPLRLTLTRVSLRQTGTLMSH